MRKNKNFQESQLIKKPLQLAKKDKKWGAGNYKKEIS